eukprot:6174651-Pleurochrysis_carterae.AAC.5
MIGAAPFQHIQPAHKPRAHVTACPPKRRIILGRETMSAAQCESKPTTTVTCAFDARDNAWVGGRSAIRPPGACNKSVRRMVVCGSLQRTYGSLLSLRHRKACCEDKPDGGIKASSRFSVDVAPFD